MPYIDPSITLSDVSIYNKDHFIVRSKPYKPEAANEILGVFKRKDRRTYVGYLNITTTTIQ
jgi:hypothetical protein